MSLRDRMIQEGWTPRLALSRREQEHEYWSRVVNEWLSSGSVKDDYQEFRDEYVKTHPKPWETVQD